MSTSSCPTENLASDAGARITWCPECESFHLALGFVQISLSAAQFNHLHGLINQAMLTVNQRRQHETPEIPTSALTRHSLH